MQGVHNLFSGEFTPSLAAPNPSPHRARAPGLYHCHMTETAPAALQAIILAGGLSRRLGGVPKAGLMFEGQTLLARTVDAAARVIGAWPGVPAAQAAVAVVGPVGEVAVWLETAASGHRARTVQEDPPFSGPAAGIAAGLEALDSRDGHVLVLACDMPRVGEIVQLLAAELAACAPGQGVMAVAGGRKQPLAAIYPLAALRLAVAEAGAAHRLENASVFSLVASVNIKECAVPPGLTADIDTWEDARAQGIAAEPAGAEG